MTEFEHNHEPTPEELMADRATGDAVRGAEDADQESYDRAAASLQAALTPRESMPDKLRSRLILEGEAIVAAKGRRSAGASQTPPSGPRRSVLPWLAAAACLALAIGTAAVAWRTINQRNTELTQQAQLAAELQERVDRNNQLLADARTRSESLAAQLDASSDEHARAIAEATSRNTRLAEELARITADFEGRLAETGSALASAEARIIELTTPLDPAQIAANRRKLLEVPDTVRIEWVPFDLGAEPDLFAEQRGDVKGDVVWNDERQEGYLRFAGLKVNDPSTEQYQVWLIDERGMEQKVSGGVFNANAAGEIIVPIEPGIDVGRVAVFAITVEDPGGIWVPDLKRRVVIAPRAEDDQGE